MSGTGAVGRLSWAAIAAGLVLAGCGSAAAPAAASRPGPANGSAPHARAVQPNSAQRCTAVYCVPQVVPRGPANGSAPNARAAQPNSAQRCTAVYCVPQVVPRGPANGSGPTPGPCNPTARSTAPRSTASRRSSHAAPPTISTQHQAVQPNSAQRCTAVYCVPQVVPRGPAAFATPG